ncbi:anti-sigma factor RsiW [Streptacidiphilus sp. MAP12-16]|uniref:anti-sigma factor n=1 Tax=Streptacidiphilus sp. MAP12-16 TaxID=3156300 RepID=UPI0035178C4F
MECRESVALGGYLLGALDPAERAAVEQHLTGCTLCRAELLRMAPLPGLLRHTPFEELPETTAGTASPAHAGPATGPAEAAVEAPGGLDRAEQDDGDRTEQDDSRRHGPRSPRVRRDLIASALAVAALGTAIGIYMGTSVPADDHARPVVTLSATDASTHVSTTATLTPEPSGTEVRLTLTGLPSGITCHLLVHARDGRTETAAGWASGYSRSTSIPASTSISPQDITRMDVVSDSGQLLVEIPHP